MAIHEFHVMPSPQQKYVDNKINGFTSNFLSEMNIGIEYQHDILGQYHGEWPS